MKRANQAGRRTGAVERGDGGDADGEGLAGGRGKGDGGRGTWSERADEGGVDSGEAAGEEARRGRGAVERAMAPPARRAETTGVVLVEVRQEVRLAAAGELVHRYQALLHGSPPLLDADADASPNLAVPSLRSPVPVTALQACWIEFLAALLKRENKREEGKRHERAARQIENIHCPVYSHIQPK